MEETWSEEFFIYEVVYNHQNKLGIIVLLPPKQKSMFFEIRFFFHGLAHSVICLKNKAGCSSYVVRIFTSFFVVNKCPVAWCIFTSLTPKAVV